MQRFAFPVTFSALDAAMALSHTPYFVWLDSNRPAHPQSCYSYVLFDPGHETLRQDHLVAIPDIPPFQGGWVGFKTYEGQEFFQYYHQLLSFDHHTGRGWFVIGCEGEAEAQRVYDAVCTRVRMARPMPAQAQDPVVFQSNFQEGDYKQAVADIISRILNGDIFQANLTHQFTAQRPAGFDPFAQYLRLREINPAPFAAYLSWGDQQILSSSPESFISVTAEGDVITSPIKGTDRDADRLRASVKDRAENVMIVDLLRNDLSQVCTDESVEVTTLCELQSFAGLHHLVSEIRGTLRSGQTARDVLNACFPGGSITGAPKIEAIKILREVERIPRGVYCGAIGWMGDDGAMEMNIPIRTLVVTPDYISFGVGGGITALSDPDAEYQETLLKADKILQSFAGE
jgi:para-aminobenzoate synthetase component 1